MAQRSTRLTPPEAAVEVLTILEDAGIPGAIGGAIALGYYSDPRGTLDADINVFVDAEDAAPALTALQAGGLELAVESAAERVARSGDLYLEHRGCRVDLYFNSIPLHSDAARRAREVTLLGRRVRILSAEDLVARKESKPLSSERNGFDPFCPVVDRQNPGDPAHRGVATGFDPSLVFQAALVLEIVAQVIGEGLLYRPILAVGVGQSTRRTLSRFAHVSRDSRL